MNNRRDCQHTNKICQPQRAVSIAATASSQKAPRAQSELLGAQSGGLHSLSVLHKWKWFPKLCNRVAVSSWNQRRDQTVGPRGRIVGPPALSKLWNYDSSPFRRNWRTAFIKAFSKCQAPTLAAVSYLPRLCCLTTTSVGQQLTCCSLPDHPPPSFSISPIPTSLTLLVLNDIIQTPKQKQL